MRKNKAISIIKVLSLFMTSFFEILFVIGLITCFIVNGTNEFKIGFTIIILSLLLFQFVILEVLSFLFSNLGKHKIVISTNKIIYKKEAINTAESRIIYSKINFDNFLTARPGELTVIHNGKGIVLGWFSRREIKRISKFIDNIKIG